MVSIISSAGLRSPGKIIFNNVKKKKSHYSVKTFLLAVFFPKSFQPCKYSSSSQDTKPLLTISYFLYILKQTWLHLYMGRAHLRSIYTTRMIETNMMRRKNLIAQERPK